MLAQQQWDYTVLNLVCPELPVRPDGLPNNNMLAGFDPQKVVGALYYFGADVDDVFFSRGNMVSDEEVVYGYMGNERYFPVDSEVPLDLVRQAIKEFLATARRPTCVQWQPYDAAASVAG